MNEYDSLKKEIEYLKERIWGISVALFVSIIFGTFTIALIAIKSSVAMSEIQSIHATMQAPTEIPNNVLHR